MMAMVKFAILLLVAFTATALENSHEIDSNHELHPYLSLAPAPSMDAEEISIGNVICGIRCAFTCHKKEGWRKVFCVVICLIQCAIDPSESVSEIACAGDCAQSSANNLRYEMMDDRTRACSQQCKKD